MLSTHVLDTARGCPAAGMLVTLYRFEAELRKKIAQANTDQDGRIAAPFGGDLEPGVYELVFDVIEYYDDAFYDQVLVRFRTDSPTQRYHVPLLLSPYGYTTYRGS